MSDYRVIVSYSVEEQTYLARAPELPGATAQGKTRAEAIAKLEEEMAAQLENMKAQGVELPVPLDETPFEGKLACEVSPSLHRELAFMAKSEGVELEKLLVELLAAAASRRFGAGRSYRPRQEGHGGGRRRQEGQGNRYHDIMENRADFIEYVRGLETGGNRGGGRGGRRGKR